jgi:hypothetical protein
MFALKIMIMSLFIDFPWNLEVGTWNSSGARIR